MKISFGIIGALLLVGVGCSSTINTEPVKTPETKNEAYSNTKSTDATSASETSVTLPEVNTKPIANLETNKKIMFAVMHTNKGDITIQLNDATPKTVDNFVTLAKKGFYDGTKFHRVIEGFMNQGGDPLSKDDGKKALWGTGGPGYQFADEIMPGNKNDVGTISMANAGPNTNGSQFFINVAANNFLDTKHTVFGKVTSGLDVVMAINKVDTDGSDKPLEAVVINSITLQ